MIKLDRADVNIRFVRIHMRDSLWNIIGSDAGVDANQLREGVSVVDDVLYAVENYISRVKIRGSGFHTVPGIIDFILSILDD